MISLSLLLLCSVSSILFWQHYKYSSLNITEDGYSYYLKPGSSISTMANDLADAGILKYPKLLILLTQLNQQTRELKAGEYALPRGTTPKGLLKKIVRGEVIFREFTLVEGWRFQEVMQALSQNAYLEHDLQGKSWEEAAKELNIPEHHPEGIFYPDTYYVVRGDSESDVLKMAYNTMKKLLQQAWAERADNLPYKTPYEALIAASMIEEEAKIDDERSKISGVIVRRIKKGMPLQIDATVIYGLGDQLKGSLRHKHLRIDSPYNTYTHKGLPPTPIAMPNIMSIYAALHPDDGDSLYYVVKGDASHVFSKTLKEHRRAFKAYKKQRDAQEKPEAIILFRHCEEYSFVAIQNYLNKSLDCRKAVLGMKTVIPLQIPSVSCIPYIMC